MRAITPCYNVLLCFLQVNQQKCVGMVSTSNVLRILIKKRRLADVQYLPIAFKPELYTQFGAYAIFRLKP